MTGPVVTWLAIAASTWLAAWLKNHPVALFIVLWCAGCGAVLAAYFWATRTGYYERQERRYTPRHAPAPAAPSPLVRLTARVRSRHPEAEAGGRETAGGESRAGVMAPVPAEGTPQGWPGTTPPASTDLGTAAGSYDFLPVTTATCPAGHDPVKVDRPSPAHPPGWTGRQPWATAPLPVVPDRAMAGA